MKREDLERYCALQRMGSRGDGGDDASADTGTAPENPTTSISGRNN
jgi:hypothetical protein